MSEQLINFSSTNFLGYIDGRWTLQNSILTSDGVLQINSGGSATLQLIDEVQAQFTYMQIKVEFSGDCISPENNYKTNPTIYTREVYKDINTNEVNKQITRALCFNTLTSTIDGYIDTTIFKTGNSPMAKFQIKITNDTEEILVIKSIQAFQSIDISESQISNIVQSITKAGAAEKFKVYHNDDAQKSLNGLGVFIQNSSYELKFKPTYYDGQLIAIETNSGQAVSIEHLIEQIDLSE